VVSGPATDPDPSFDCTWLEDATGHRVVVIYPPGWDERFNPTRILDATGAVFAVEGDLVRVTYVPEGIGASACFSRDADRRRDGREGRRVTFADTKGPRGIALV
jgi:hypothetical protein